MEEPSKTDEIRRRELRGAVFAFLGATCWGFSASCISWLTTYTNASVLWLADMRLLFAGSLFMIVALVKRRDQLIKMFRTPRLRWQLGVYTIVGVLLLQVSYMSAIKYTNPGTALLLQESAVAFVLVYTCLRVRRFPRLIELIALVLAIFGIVVIATQGDLSSISINFEGLVWGLISGIAMAGYNIIPTRLIKECGLISMNAASLFLGAIVLTPFVQPWNAGVELGVDGWLVLGGVVIVGTMLAYALYLRGVADTGAVRASLIGVFEPVSGAIFAAVWLGIAFTTWDFIGGAAIIIMMILVFRHSGDQKNG